MALQVHVVRDQTEPRISRPEFFCVLHLFHKRAELCFVKIQLGLQYFYERRLRRGKRPCLLYRVEKRRTDNALARAALGKQVADLRHAPRGKDPCFLRFYPGYLFQLRGLRQLHGIVVLLRERVQIRRVLHALRKPCGLCPPHWCGLSHRS